MTTEELIEALQDIQKQSPLGANTPVYLCNEDGCYAAIAGADYEIEGGESAVLYL